MNLKKIVLSVAMLGMVSFGANRVSRADAQADMGEKVMVMVESLAGIIDDNKKDCDAMGAKLSSFLDTNAQMLKDMKAKDKTMSKADKDAWAAKYKDRLTTATQKMMGGMSACKDNAKVTDAMKKFQ